MTNQTIHTGAKFGMWTVLQPFSPTDRLRVECKCDCGAVGYPFRGALLAGKTQRCRDCYLKANAEQATQRDPIAKRLWNSGQLYRSEWGSFAVFEEWVKGKYQDGMKLYRIDPTKPHGPTNSELRLSRWEMAIAAIAAHRNTTIEATNAWAATVSRTRVYTLYDNILNPREKRLVDRISDEEATQLRELVDAGHTQTAIVKRLGLSSRAVKRKLMLLNVTPKTKPAGRPRKTATPEMLADINEMRVQGATYATIAAKYGVSVATCRQWAGSV